jgi:hypothetical protein
MDANIVALIIGLIAIIPGSLALVRQLQADKVQAGKTSYSQEIIRLRNEIEIIRDEVDRLKRARASDNDLIIDLQTGIRRLTSQLDSLGIVPIWRPKIEGPK